MSKKEEYIQYYDDGKKSREGTYKDGKEDGLWTWWDENGNKKEEGTIKENERDGRRTYYKDGKKLKRRWNDK